MAAVFPANAKKLTLVPGEPLSLWVDIVMVSESKESKDSLSGRVIHLRR